MKYGFAAIILSTISLLLDSCAHTFAALAAAAH